MYQEEGDYVFLEQEMRAQLEQLEANPALLWKNADRYAQQYDSELWQHPSKGMRESGHGGMDYLVLRAMIHAAKGETAPAIDVYDAASWMCITALSEQSVANGGAPVEIPDFTKGSDPHRRDAATGKYAL